MSDKMKRYFFSHAPRFGNYKKPQKSLIEKSPYYFWWLALSLNTDYTSNEKRSADLMVSADFGQISQSYDRYVDFTNWWLRKVSPSETQGEFLFAEPLSDAPVKQLKTFEDAKAYIEDNDRILLSISMSGQRKFIDAELEKIFRKHANFEHGRRVKKSSNSKARYKLSKPVNVKTLKRIFKVYEYKQNKVDNFTNYQIFKKINYSLERYENENLSEYRRRVSTFISRDYSAAKKMIENAGKGIFP